MRYLALLFGPEGPASEPGSPAWNEELAAYDRFNELAGETIVGGEALQPSATAVTIRHEREPRSGDRQVVVSDGPFTESAEVVGGLFVLEVDDLDAAIEVARNIPAAQDGAVELRPLVAWGQQDGPEGSTRYLALLAGAENEASQPDTDEWNGAVAAHARFEASAGDAVLGGGALHPASSATTVRVRDGELLLSDGPFTEASEIVGGLYLLAAADRDDAIRLARAIPMGDGGIVELRPVVEFDG